MQPTVAELSVIKLPAFRDSRGMLVVAELEPIAGFSANRIFWIYGVPADKVRGGHAHKECHQFMISMKGRITIAAFDGVNSRDIVLNELEGVHVPPGIFCEERFDAPDSLLTVLCDQRYDKNDYIYERSELVETRSAGKR